MSNEPIGIAQILAKLKVKASIPTINRDLLELKSANFILSQGKGPGTKYTVNFRGLIHAKINTEKYFETDADGRKIIEKYNPSVFDMLRDARLFTPAELTRLNTLTNTHKKKIAATSAARYKKEFERLLIELSMEVITDRGQHLQFA